MADVWEGMRAQGREAKKQAFFEGIELQPIDPQTNGPQLLYGLRYHTHITQPDEVKTYHDQVGYWLWEPATGTIIHSLTIPRGQVAMAAGQAAADATEFELVATQGLDTYVICSAPFLQHAFKTTEFRINVTIDADGTGSYDEDTMQQILGRDEPFHHTGRNTLTKVAEPTPNPLARGQTFGELRSGRSDSDLQQAPCVRACLAAVAACGRCPPATRSQRHPGIERHGNHGVDLIAGLTRQVSVVHSLHIRLLNLNFNFKRHVFFAARPLGRDGHALAHVKPLQTEGNTTARAGGHCATRLEAAVLHLR